MLNRTNIQGGFSFPSGVGAPGLHTTTSMSFSLLPGQKAAMGGSGYQEPGPFDTHRSPMEPRSSRICSQPSSHTAHAPGPVPSSRRCSQCLSFPPRARLTRAGSDFPRHDRALALRRQEPRSGAEIRATAPRCSPGTFAVDPGDRKETPHNRAVTRGLFELG